MGGSSSNRPSDESVISSPSSLVLRLARPSSRDGEVLAAAGPQISGTRPGHTQLLVVGRSAAAPLEGAVSSTRIRFARGQRPARNA